MKKPRAVRPKSWQKRTAKTAAIDLRIPATSVLTTIRRIKRSIANAFGPQERAAFGGLPRFGRESGRA